MARNKNRKEYIENRKAVKGKTDVLELRFKKRTTRSLERVVL